MARTLDQLFTSYSPETCKQRLLDRCTAKGLPITDWYEGGVARTLIEIEAQENSDFSLSNVEIAKAAFFESSPGGDWTTLDAKDWFSTSRLEATYTLHEQLAYNGSTSSITIVPGQLWAANPDGLRFVNTTGGTIAANGAYLLSVTFRAEYPGAAYILSPTVLLTPIPGLDVSENNDTFWTGTDAETDAALKARCYLKWATLGTGMADDAYTYWAKSYANGQYCTKTKIVTDVAGAGIVTVWVGGPYGASGAAVGIQNLLRSKAGNAVTVNVSDAITYNATVVSTPYIKSGQDALGLKNQGIANLRAAVLALEIGETLYKAQIMDALMVPGVTNCVISTPASDLSIGTYGLLAYQVPTISVVYI